MKSLFKTEQNKVENPKTETNKKPTTNNPTVTTPNKVVEEIKLEKFAIKVTEADINQKIDIESADEIVISE